jgi:DNA-binding Lrp family transcriptional regulator
MGLDYSSRINQDSGDKTQILHIGGTQMQQPWQEMQTLVEFDDVDRKLLRLLADDARITNASLASRAGIPASTCISRVRNLNGSGVLEGHHARIQRRALGLALDVLVGVSLKSKQAAAVHETVEYIKQLRHVTTVLRTSGPFDLLVNAYLIDTDHLLTQLINPLTENKHVANTQTFLVSEHWHRASLLGEFFPS